MTWVITSLSVTSVACRVSQAVVDQDHVSPGPDVPGQTFVRGGAAIDGAFDVVDGDGEHSPVHQRLLAGSETAEPDLGPLEISEHPDGATDHPGRLAHVLQVHLMIGIVAVAHVQPGDIHSGPDQFDQALRGRRGGPERADNLGSTHELT